jgi:hypothetical protein
MRITTRKDIEVEFAQEESAVDEGAEQRQSSSDVRHNHMARATSSPSEVLSIVDNHLHPT